MLHHLDEFPDFRVGQLFVAYQGADCSLERVVEVTADDAPEGGTRVVLSAYCWVESMVMADGFMCEDTFLFHESDECSDGVNVWLGFGEPVKEFTDKHRAMLPEQAHEFFFTFGQFDMLWHRMIFQLS